MSEIKLAETLETSVLVSRPAARRASQAIEAAVLDESGILTFDFEHIRVVAPSFLDELLLMTEKAENASGSRKRIVFRNYPPGTESTLAAIGRAHDADVVLDERGAWVFTSSA